MVADASVPGLEARGFTDPEITGLLRDSGREMPDRPALMIVTGTDVEVLAGITPADRVVDSPPDSLANNDAVHIEAVTTAPDNAK